MAGGGIVSLAPELAAFIGRPPAKPAKGVFVPGDFSRSQAHPHSSKNATPTTEGETMPRGVYERKPRASKVEAKPEARPAKARTKRPEGKGPRVTRKSRQRPADGARFGVFEDGTIRLNLPSCTGIVGPDDARDLVGFLKRIGIDA